MEAGPKFNICDLETSHLHNDDVQDLPSRIERSVPPRYHMHSIWLATSLGYVSRKIFAHIDDFLHVRLIYWLEVMSLIKEIPWLCLHYSC
jgi:hypothetical protein